LRIYRERLEEAASILRHGGTVAFPTETVFGLGAKATDSTAVQKVFDAKGRPSDNPLIVHLADRDQIAEVATDVPDVGQKLLEKFSPGPLTLVLPKRSAIPDCVSAGLPTVAVRIPREPLAHELLQRAALPVAAPSANRSGRPSGTTWQSVLEELDGRIDAVVCENPSIIGLESTVVDVASDPPRLLRSGAISAEQLIPWCPDLRTVHSTEIGSANAPGLRHRHYQPHARVRIVRDPYEVILGVLGECGDRAESVGCRHGFIGMDRWPDKYPIGYAVECETVEEYASKLFESFREADRRGIQVLHCQSVPETGLGTALMDRLRRAAQ
jgi:L-threonylcarbamoyladenylate synthase